MLRRSRLSIYDVRPSECINQLYIYYRWILALIDMAKGGVVRYSEEFRRAHVLNIKTRSSGIH